MAATWPLGLRAQPRERMRRIGVLLPATADDAVFQPRLEAFLKGLALFGWTIGGNVRTDIRWATANATDIRRQAANWLRSHRMSFWPMVDRPWRRCCK